MKFLASLVLLLEALLLTIYALPINYRTRQQTLTITPQLSPSSTASYDSSIDLEADNSRKKLSQYLPFSFKTSKQSSSFRCHTYPEPPPLPELADFIKETFRTYSDQLFDHKTDSDRIPIETCLAGYRSDKTSPSIYFGGLGKKQLERVQQILKNKVPQKFPEIKVEVMDHAVALVLVKPK